MTAQEQNPKLDAAAACAEPAKTDAEKSSFNQTPAAQAAQSDDEPRTITPSRRCGSF